MGDDAQLAALLRTTQWALDELAHDLPAGQASPERIREMADALEKVINILRRRAGDVIDPEN